MCGQLELSTGSPLRQRAGSALASAEPSCPPEQSARVASPSANKRLTRSIIVLRAICQITCAQNISTQFVIYHDLIAGADEHRWTNQSAPFPIVQRRAKSEEYVGYANNADSSLYVNEIAALTCDLVVIA